MIKKHKSCFVYTCQTRLDILQGQALFRSKTTVDLRCLVSMFDRQFIREKICASLTENRNIHIPKNCFIALKFMSLQRSKIRNQRSKWTKALTISIVTIHTNFQHCILSQNIEYKYSDFFNVLDAPKLKQL